MPFHLILAKDGRYEEDVTLSGRYMPIVMLTQTKNPNAKAKLEEARCRRPDDADIRYFFRHRFPNVRLVGGASHTNVGDHAACDDNVQIAYRLARCLTLSAKAKSYNKQIDPSQIIASYIAVLLHELAHCLLVWWSRGDCRTPDFGPLLRESGEFVEEAFLGGVLEGWALQVFEETGHRNTVWLFSGTGARDSAMSHWRKRHNFIGLKGCAPGKL
ncbi:uncharacterized protein LACBIDRAFT_321528 [Laccaria bicolor S238N-H82]|uniref:Predicted protein n=1 Tax=Laccaria bicolor (strain S238N-H82 / ATCC MYA-4686) TaxID=486041 RepID=B0CT98_LACBS|nr:uncharacterized protein LACBIDRAFT_321528 [Laccaria bicolor S238N-H82]EDR13881.1 predicted protein [Laccaria bicolor S238N-H82]|eukprot:XP_001874440.1 predicted protein [Laccaria bicolor S238N-H82]